MSKKYVIAGGVAAGAGIAARLRRLDEEAEILVLEKGPYVSFSNCALPFYLSHTVDKAEKLLMMTPQAFEKRYRITTLVNHEVTKIDRKHKTVTVLDHSANKETEEAYDVLFLATGAKPIVPSSIRGTDLPHVFTVRNVPDITSLHDYLKENEVKNVTVIGGGFIGLEVMENLVHAGYRVTLTEAANQVMTRLDEDMAQIVHKEIIDHGVELVTGDGVSAITKEDVELSSGKKIKAEAVVLAIGVTPDTALAKEAGLELNSDGSIRTDENGGTGDPYIYAAGDAIDTRNAITGKSMRLTMAGAAQKEARITADSLYGKSISNKGFLGSSVFRCFDKTVAMSGLNEKDCQKEGIDCDAAYIIPSDRVGIMPGAGVLHLKLIFEKPSGRILGIQAIGAAGAAEKRVDACAAMIYMNATLEQLAMVDFCYSPLYSTARDPLNHAALVGLNLLQGDLRQVRVSDVRRLCEEGAFIIDCREEREYAAGHLKTAVNIPLSQFRDRLDEIPKDRPVYVHCRSSQRSYNMVRALVQDGYDAWNISGSYLGICLYEYYHDQTTGREPIVTEYNFH